MSRHRPFSFFNDCLGFIPRGLGSVMFGITYVGRTFTSYTEFPLYNDVCTRKRTRVRLRFQTKRVFIVSYIVFWIFVKLDRFLFITSFFSFFVFSHLIRSFSNSAWNSRHDVVIVYMSFALISVGANTKKYRDIRGKRALFCRLNNGRCRNDATYRGNIAKYAYIVISPALR